jgi:hypothetical protein
MPLAVVTGSSGGIGQKVCNLLVVRKLAVRRASCARCATPRCRAPRPGGAPALPPRLRCRGWRCAPWHAARQAEGYTVVGIDRAACAELDKRVAQFQCDIRELLTDAECEAPAKRGTGAARQLKALLASLQASGASSSAAPAGTKLDLLVNNAACQSARGMRALACNAARPTDVSRNAFRRSRGTVRRADALGLGRRHRHEPDGAVHAHQAAAARAAGALAAAWRARGGARRVRLPAPSKGHAVASQTHVRAAAFCSWDDAPRQAAKGAVVMVSSIHANLTKPGACLHGAPCDALLGTYFSAAGRLPQALQRTQPAKAV